MNQRQNILAASYRVALCAYLFTLVLVMYWGTDDPTTHVKTLLTSWAAAILAGSYLVITWVARIPLRRPPIFREVILCFLAFFLVSSLFSEFRAVSLLETGRFFGMFALYWLASQVFQNTTQVTQLLRVFCVAVFVSSLYALTQATGLDPFPWEETTSDTYTNLPGTFGNPNYAAHALILVIIAIPFLYRLGHRWPALFLPLFLFHLYRTHQRAGLIALAGALVLILVALLILRRPKRPAASVLACISLVALLGTGALGAALYWNYSRTGNPFPLDLSLLLRYQSYVSATNMLLDAPVLGHGPAVYGLAYAPYWTPFEQDWFAQELRMNAHVHNDLLELAIDGGLAAAGLYLAMLLLGMCYGLLLKARGTTADQRTMGLLFAALFAAFAIDGLFGFNLRVPVTAAFFFLLMGLLDGIWADATPTPAVGKKIWVHRAARLAFLFLLLLSTRQETQAFVGQYYFYQGVQAHADGQLVTAREAYAKAEAAAPWDWHAPRRIGMTLLDEGHPTEAGPWFERALEKNPHYLLVHLPMARAGLMLAQQALTTPGEAARVAALGYLDDATRHANAVLAMSPNFSAADEILGRVESIAALVERDRAAEPDTSSEQAHWMAARQHLEAAIGNGAANPGELYRMLMRVEIGLNNPDGAEQALVRAIQAGQEDDNSTWALYFSLARQQNDFSGIRDALYRHIGTLLREENTPQEARLSVAFDWLASVQQNGFNDATSALDAYRSAVLHGPLRPDAWSRFAGFAYEHRELPLLEETIKTSCAALEAAGTPPLPQVAIVNALLVDNDASLDDISRLLLATVRSQEPTQTARSNEIFGWAARMLLDHYRSLENDGSAPCETALNLGIVSATIQEFGVADGLFKHALECLDEAQKPLAAIHWSDTLMRTGRGAEALPLLEEALSKAPGQFELQWAMARTLSELKRMDEARKAYDALLAREEIDGATRTLLENERDGLPTAVLP